LLGEKIDRLDCLKCLVGLKGSKGSKGLKGLKSQTINPKRQTPNAKQLIACFCIGVDFF